MFSRTCSNSDFDVKQTKFHLRLSNKSYYLKTSKCPSAFDKFRNTQVSHFNSPNEEINYNVGILLNDCKLKIMI